MSSCCQAPDTAVDRCPRCKDPAITVPPITLKALLTSEGLRLGIPETPRICMTPMCPVVYFDNVAQVEFEESHLTIRVQAKHPDDPHLPVCYCFGVTRAGVEIGSGRASSMIAAEIKAGHCACEVRNPKGTCCLGDVLRAERVGGNEAGRGRNLE